MERLRRLGGADGDDDGRATTTTTTLLTLPLSDFASSAAGVGVAGNGSNEMNNDNHPNNDDGNDDDDDDDGLILISLPQSEDDATPTGSGGLTLDDLLHGENSVYIMGDTSERDIPNLHHLASNDSGGVGRGGSAGSSNSIEPVAARLIVERDGKKKIGKTLELTRVETSNTYIVVPTTTSTTTAMTSNHNGVDDNEKRRGGGNKRPKINNDGNSHNQEDDNMQQLVSIPARSIGLVPGEDSPACFFLDPFHLPPGHFANQLRRIFSRWMYDPFDPPPPPPTTTSSSGEDDANTTQLYFGYSITEIAHICRTSYSEVEYAIGHRVYGAEDAMVIPSSATSPPPPPSSLSSSSCSTRYGMLSEEGRQTVSMAIVSALLESDLTLIWTTEGNGAQEQVKKHGMQLSVLMKEIRAQWHQMEGEDTFRQSSQPLFHTTTTSALTNSQSSQFESQSQFGTPSQLAPSTQREGAAGRGELATEVIWHCLRPLCHYVKDDVDDDCSSRSITTNKDRMPEYVQLIPDEVAKLAAHQVFLSGTPRTTSQGNSIIASSRGGAAANNSWPEEEFMEAWSMRLPSISSSYEPRMELLRGIAISEAKESAAAGEDTNEVPKQHWTYFPEVALPLDPALRVQAMFAMRDVWTLSEAVPYLEKFIVCHEAGSNAKGLNSMVAELFGRYANAINPTGKGGSTDDHTATKYMAKH